MVTRGGKLSASWARENFPCENGMWCIWRGCAISISTSSLARPRAAGWEFAVLWAGGWRRRRVPWSLLLQPSVAPKVAPFQHSLSEQSCRNGRAPCVPELPQITPAFITVAQPQLYLKVLDFHAPSVQGVCAPLVCQRTSRPPSPAGCSPLGKQERCL